MYKMSVPDFITEIEKIYKEDKNVDDFIRYQDLTRLVQTYAEQVEADANEQFIDEHDSAYNEGYDAGYADGCDSRE